MGEVLWREAHGVDVVGAADERVVWSLQEFHSGPDTVIWVGEVDGGRDERNGSASVPPKQNASKFALPMYIIGSRVSLRRLHSN